MAAANGEGEPQQSGGDNQPYAGNQGGQYQGEGGEGRRHRDRNRRRRGRGNGGEGQQNGANGDDPSGAPQPDVGELPAFLTAGGPPVAE